MFFQWTILASDMVVEAFILSVVYYVLIKDFLINTKKINISKYVEIFWDFEFSLDFIIFLNFSICKIKMWKRLGVIDFNPLERRSMILTFLKQSFFIFYFCVKGYIRLNYKIIKNKYLKWIGVSLVIDHTLLT